VEQVLQTQIKQTTIKLKSNTRDRLAKHGSKDQTYDDLVNEMLDKLEYGDNQ
jgi:hypothetical protein